MDKRTILTSIALLSTSAFLYIYQQHRSLSQRVTHTTRCELPISQSSDDTLANASLPPSLLETPSLYTVIDDECSLAVPTSTITPTTPPTTPVLTTYLRFTMSRFNRFPQAYIMRLLFRADPAATLSFSPTHIQSLSFSPGDVVNGGYHLTARTPTQAVFTMVMPAGYPQIAGRLIVGLRERGEQTEFYSRSLQWRRRDDGTVLPMERAATMWLHQYASWSLLVAGIEHVCGRSEVD